MASLPKIKEKLDNGETPTLITAYDSTFAGIVDESNIDMLLVGDSAGLYMMGYEKTDKVTLDEMVHHTSSVTRSVENTFVIADMPFGSYNISPEQAVRNANRLKKEGGADAVKLEGGKEVSQIVSAIVKGGIPVIGHIGFTPQTEPSSNGATVKGVTAETAKALYDSAIELDEAGATGIVVDLTTEEVGKQITKGISGFSIGVGAGSYCDIQGLTMHSLLGLRSSPSKTAKGISVNLDEVVLDHFENFHKSVANADFPGTEATSEMPPSEADRFIDYINPS